MHAFLRDVCGAIGEHPSWAYAGETRDKKKSEYDAKMIENKFKIEFEEDEDERRARKFLHRGKMLEAFDDTDNHHLEKVYTERSVWNLEHGNMNLAILDVSVDEALARKAKDIYRGFCDRYMLNFYASASLISLLKSTEDEVRMAVEDDVFFEKEWLIDGPLPVQQKLTKNQSEVDKIEKILEYGNTDEATSRTPGPVVNRNEKNKKYANLLLLTWAQLGLLDGLASHRGAATFLIFDERTPSQRDGDDEDQIFTWYYREKNQQIGESADSAAVAGAASGANTPAAAPEASGAGAVPGAVAVSEEGEERESTLVAGGGGGGGGGSGGGGGGGGAPAAAPQEWTKLYIDAIEAFKKGKEGYFKKIISDREMEKGLWTSKFIKDFKWRANFLKLARTINCETELTNRFVVSGREKRLRSAEMQKKEAIYFFQSLVNKQPRISRDLLPNSYFL